MKTGLYAALVILGAILMALAVVSGIGYGLYLQGVVGLTFGSAAWAGFVVWAKMFGGGFLLYILGIIGVAVSK